MNTDIIREDDHPNGIVTVRVNRPRVRNALNSEAMHALNETVTALSKRTDLTAVILAGADGTFISGGDVRDLHDDTSEDAGLWQHDLMAGMLNRLAALPVPVITAMEGATRGGGMEVALACDLRFAAADATFGFAQGRMGVTPGWGGAARLFDAVGYSRALELLITGRTFDAAEALGLGLIQRMTGPGETLDAALALAESLIDVPPLARKGIKTVLVAYRDGPRAEARALERTRFARLWASADHAEASSAFLEKRRPTFKGE